MTESKKKGKGKAKCVYVPPRIEAHETAPGRLMGTSFWGTHNDGSDQTGDNDHNAGHIFEPEYGAKAVILGQEFSFSNMWEE